MSELSRYWPFVEHGEVFVHCTGELPPRRAEMIRCYFFSVEVCNAGLGALIVAIGAVVGIVAAVLVVLAIVVIIGACSTGVLCALGVIAAAALVAFSFAMVGATIGGLVGLFASPPLLEPDRRGHARGRDARCHRLPALCDPSTVV